jgi:hypothetical protein
VSYLQLRLRDQAEAAEQRLLLVLDAEVLTLKDEALVLDGHAGDGLEAGLELGDGPVRRDAAVRGGVGGDDAHGHGGHGGGLCRRAWGWLAIAMRQGRVCGLLVVVVVVVVGEAVVELILMGDDRAA